MSFLLPFLVPILVSAISPVATEYVKVAVEFIKGKLPTSVVVMLAAAIAEGANQAQAYVSGAALPPGVGALVSIVVNEALSDFGYQPDGSHK